MLRRLLVVGLAWAFFCAPAARARRNGRDLLLPLVRRRRRRDGAWQHWNQNGHRPPSDLYSRFYPGARPVLEQRPGGRRAADDADRVGGRRRGRRLVVGPRLRRGRAAAARRRGGAAPRARRRASTSSRTPDRSPASVALDLGYLASLRRAGRLRLPPARLRRRGLGGGARRRCPRRCGSSPARRRSASPLPAASTASTPTTSSRTPAAKFARLCAQAHAMHLACAPSVGPGYDGQPGRRAAASAGRARTGPTYDLLWTAALAAHPDVVVDHELQRVGRGHADRARPGPARLRRLRRRLGPRGRRRAETAYLARTTYWTARFHGAPVGATVDLSGMATRAVPAPLAQLPNALTLARLALIPVFVVLMVKAGDAHSWPAGIVFGDRRRDRPDRRLPRAALARRVAVREDRRPARRPADDRRRRHPPRRLRPAAVGRARRDRRARPAAPRRLARARAARHRPRRERARQGRDLAPLRRRSASASSRTTTRAGRSGSSGSASAPPSSLRCSTCATRWKALQR